MQALRKNTTLYCKHLHMQKIQGTSQKYMQMAETMLIQVLCETDTLLANSTCLLWTEEEEEVEEEEEDGEEVVEEEEVEGSTAYTDIYSNNQIQL